MHRVRGEASNSVRKQNGLKATATDEKGEEGCVSEGSPEEKGQQNPPKMEFITQVYMIGMHSPTVAVFLKPQSLRNHGCSV